METHINADTQTHTHREASKKHLSTAVPRLYKKPPEVLLIHICFSVVKLGFSPSHSSRLSLQLLVFHSLPVPHPSLSCRGEMDAARRFFFSLSHFLSFFFSFLFFRPAQSQIQLDTLPHHHGGEGVLTPPPTTHARALRPVYEVLGCWRSWGSRRRRGERCEI